MSKEMLHGVLNIPLDMWNNTDLFKVQQHARCVEASELIKDQERLIELQNKALDLANMKIKSLIQKVKGEQ